MRPTRQACRNTAPCGHLRSVSDENFDVVDDPRQAAACGRLRPEGREPRICNTADKHRAPGVERDRREMACRHAVACGRLGSVSDGNFDVTDEHRAFSEERGRQQ